MRLLWKEDGNISTRYFPRHRSVVARALLSNFVEHRLGGKSPHKLEILVADLKFDFDSHIHLFRFVWRGGLRRAACSAYSTYVLLLFNTTSGINRYSCTWYVSRGGGYYIVPANWWERHEPHERSFAEFLLTAQFLLVLSPSRFPSFPALLDLDIYCYYCLPRMHIADSAALLLLIIVVVITFCILQWVLCRYVVIILLSCCMPG